MHQQYNLRGNRVIAMDRLDIARNATSFCHVFGLNKRKVKRFDQTLEQLVLYGITLSIIDDKEWQKNTGDVTIGHYDPGSFTISIPQRIYDNACKGERDALFVLLHELGHLVLGHRTLLHHSTKSPEQNEDAEWQADTFAEVALRYLGFETDQLTFDFYM